MVPATGVTTPSTTSATAWPVPSTTPPTEPPTAPPTAPVTPVTRPPAPAPTDPTAPPTAPPTVPVVGPSRAGHDVPGSSARRALDRVTDHPGCATVPPARSGPARGRRRAARPGGTSTGWRHGGAEPDVLASFPTTGEGCPACPRDGAACCATVVGSTAPIPWTACAATGPPATSAAVPMACTRVAAGTVWLASTGTSDSQATTPCARRSRGADTEIIARTTAGSNWVPEQRTSSRRAAARLTGRR